METCVIGIDPGKSGGICIHYAGGDVEAAPMPETQGDILNYLCELQSGTKRVVCYIEKIPPFMGTDIPQSHVAVMFENYGFIKGVVQGMRVPLYEIRPQVWMQSLGIGGYVRQRAPNGSSADIKKQIKTANGAAQREWKRKLRGEAQRRYPSLKTTLAKSDAILIMDYGLRQQAGSPVTTHENTNAGEAPMDTAALL